MARNVRRSRIVVQQPVVQQQRKRRVDDEDEEGSSSVKLRRGDHKRNRLHTPDMYYGFLAHADGPPGGPWYAAFECTPQSWMNPTIVWLSNNYYDRVRRILNRRDFETTWEDCAIAERVVIRHAREEFIDHLTDDELAPQLALYEILLYAEDLERFGFDAPLVPGTWYGVEVLRQEGADPNLEMGMLYSAAKGSLELAKPEAYSLAGLRKLRPVAEMPDEMILDDPYFSQALIQAFHSHFAEDVVLPLPDDEEDDDSDASIDLEEPNR